MKYTYFGKNINITEGLKSYTESKLQYLDMYFGGEKNIKITMSIQKGMQKIDVTVCFKDFIIRAEESSSDMYMSIDLISDKLHRLVEKEKQKFSKKGCKSIKHLGEEYSESIYCGSNIISRRNIEVKPMSEEEAILQMELLNYNFYMFINLSGNTNVIYKKNDKEYGIIESCN